MMKIKSLLSLLCLLFLVACQPDEVATQNDGPSAFQTRVVGADFAVGQPRVPFVIMDGTDIVSDFQSVKLAAFDLSNEDGNETPVWEGEATSYTDYEVPYYVVYAPFEKAGIWGFSLEVETASGSIEKSEFVIQVQDKSVAPDVGDAAPASNNRTVETEPDLAKLTSADVPDEGLYQLTVAEAITADKPTVIVFATPKFCPTRFCAPVVNSVSDVRESVGEDANFIHIEIYKEFTPDLIPADEIKEWGLSSEPWIFVLDSDGTVTSRLSGPVSPVEINEQLEPLLQ